MCGIQLFQLTLSDQSIISFKSGPQGYVEFFMNKFIKSALPRSLVKIYDGEPFG